MRAEATGGVGGADGHQLCPERWEPGHVGGHQAEERTPAEFKNRANRLLHAASGEFDEGALHGLDEIGHVEVGADFVFVEKAGRLHGGECT